MKFTFAESVKLATKGFKPEDIKDLSLLDEDKFSKDDILSLVGNGYSKTDIKKLVDIFSSDNNEDKNNEDPNEDENNEDSGTEDHTKKQDKEKSKNDSLDDDPETDDNIDYKELYEKEKKLREELQHKKAKENSDIKDKDGKTDFDIAVDIANSI